MFQLRTKFIEYFPVNGNTQPVNSSTQQALKHYGLHFGAFL